jgi:hypothetical protein
MMKKTAVSIMVVFIAIAFTLNAMGENKFKLLRSKNIDASQWKDYLGAKRTQYDIEVAANTGDEEIKNILEQAVKELAKKRNVDALAVRLYLKDTNLPYAIATWAPDGDWSKAERGKPKSIFKTSIEIYPEHRPKESSNVEKFGLSLEKRKMIYREISDSQKRTDQMATRKYPSDIMKQIDYMRELDKKYEKQICDKYHITDKQKLSIIAEGVSNNWPD